MCNQNSLLYILAFLALLTAYLSTKFPMSTSPHSMPPHAIIIGSGLAGLSAASQLLTHGIPVLLLERSTKPGGNSIKASSGINAAPTTYQPVTEPLDAFSTDTRRSAGRAMQSLTAQREKLVETLTCGSAGAVAWLVNEKGVDLSRVAQLGGHSFARTHRGSGRVPPGYAIVSALLKDVKANELFKIRTSCTVMRVLSDGKRVTGVRYMCEDGEAKDVHGPVIFASGGFGGDAKGLLAKYRPDLTDYPSTNDPRPGTQPLLTAVGAQLVDMEQVQVHPTGFVDSASPTSPLKFLAAEMLRGEGGILLLNGKRFVNELDTREKVAGLITSTPSMTDSPKQWGVQIVLDEGTYNAAKSHVDFYIFKGLMKKITLSELGPDALESVKLYATAASDNTTDPLGRISLANWTLKDATPDSVVYVGTVTPVVHFTMGGVLLNERSEILDESNTPIDGLWGAGEVTGGVHGGNRLGGSSLLECVVFGRIAGDEVARVMKGDD
jgi:FAD-dependent fumarate reductase